MHGPPDRQPRGAQAQGDGDRRRAGAPAVSDVAAQVTAIVERVRAEGDAAVLALFRELDTGGAEPWPLRVDALQLQEALAALPDPTARGAGAGRGERARESFNLRSAPIRTSRCPRARRSRSGRSRSRGPRSTCPWARAPYPSTVVMGAVTAQAAGVDEVVVCSPPREDGDVDPTVLAACALCGVEEVYRMGGAQAVAALALGTDGVPRVDVIAGPGNVWVQEAGGSSRASWASTRSPARRARRRVHRGADPALVALDMRAQAEHGPDSRVVGLTPSPISPRPWRPPSRTRAARSARPAWRTRWPSWRRSPRAPAAHGPGGRDAGAACAPRRLRVRRRGPGRRSGTTSPAPTTSCRRAAPPVRLGAVRADLPPGGHAGAGCALREARAERT